MQILCKHKVNAMQIVAGHAENSCFTFWMFLDILKMEFLIHDQLKSQLWNLWVLWANCE